MSNMVLKRRILDTLWEALEGGSYDLPTVRSALKDDSRFVEDLGLDSLDLVEFYMRIEDLFKIEIPADEYAELTSVAALQTFLSEASPELHGAS